TTPSCQSASTLARPISGSNAGKAPTENVLANPERQNRAIRRTRGHCRSRATNGQRALGQVLRRRRRTAASSVYWRAGDALAMPERLRDFFTVIDGGTLLVAAAAWLVATVLTIAVVLLVVVTLPPTYFVTSVRARSAARGVSGRLWVVARNLLGLALILL